jgi:hypothetical protein
MEIQEELSSIEEVRRRQSLERYRLDLSTEVTQLETELGLLLSDGSNPQLRREATGTIDRLQTGIALTRAFVQGYPPPLTGYEYTGYDTESANLSSLPSLPNSRQVELGGVTTVTAFRLGIRTEAVGLAVAEIEEHIARADLPVALLVYFHDNVGGTAEQVESIARRQVDRVITLFYSPVFDCSREHFAEQVRIGLALLRTRTNEDSSPPTDEDSHNHTPDSHDIDSENYSTHSRGSSLQTQSIV